MDLSLEKIAKIRQLSAYEIKRNKPLPDLIHSFLQPQIMFELHIRLGDNFSIFPELDLIMPEKTIAVPDIVIYPKMKVDFSNDILVMEEMPLTTIEIMTPPQDKDDMIARAKRYLSAGVKSSWIVFPALKGITIYKSPNEYNFFHEKDIVKDSVVGIEISVEKIFE
jgi:Putative restriction endonuclease